MNTVSQSTSEPAADRAERAARTGTDALILDAAARAFTELGYAGTTIGDIAIAAKTSRPTIYSYFASKEEIFRRLAERVRDDFTDAQRVPQDLPADQIIRLSDTSYLRSYTANLGLLTIIQHQALSDDGIRDLWLQLHTRINAAHERFMQRLVDEGDADPVASLSSISDAVNGTVMRYAQLVEQDPNQADRLADDLVRIHLAMLGLRTVGPDRSRQTPR